MEAVAIDEAWPVTGLADSISTFCSSRVFSVAVVIDVVVVAVLSARAATTTLVGDWGDSNLVWTFW